MHKRIKIQDLSTGTVVGRAAACLQMYFANHNSINFFFRCVFLFYATLANGLKVQFHSGLHNLIMLT